MSDQNKINGIVDKCKVLLLPEDSSTKANGPSPSTCDARGIGVCKFWLWVFISIVLALALGQL